MHASRLPQIYEEFHHTVNNADHQKDLKWWANNHGVNMAMGWPQFEVWPMILTLSNVASINILTVFFAVEFILVFCLNEILSGIFWSSF